MAKRTKHTVDITLTTAADLVGVNRTIMIEPLHKAGHLSRNNRLDNIASSSMVKLGYFMNDLRYINNKPTQRVYELPLVTVWGMHFLREFCKDKDIKPAKEKPRLAEPTKQISAKAEATRQQLHDMVANS